MSLQELCYKTVRLDGFDIHSRTYNYAQAEVTGKTIRHPLPGRINPLDDSTYFSVSTAPGDALGNRHHPEFGAFRLFVVEPIGEVAPVYLETYPTWRGVKALRVVGELDPLQALGPNGVTAWRFLTELDSRYLDEEAVQYLAQRHAPLASGETAERLSRYARKNDRMAAAYYAIVHARAMVARNSPDYLPDDVRSDAARVCTHAVTAVILRDVLGSEYDALVRPLREVFGADYA